jgi:methyl-accepting chemotaxis protein
MRQIPFAGKAAILVALSLCPTLLLIGFLFWQVTRDEFAAQERVGTAYTQALRPLFADLEAYRLAATDAAVDKPALAARIETDFSTAFAADAGVGAALGLTQSLQSLRAKWQRHAAIDGIISDLIALLGAVSDNSKITLDPILDGYFIGDAMVNKVPGTIDSLAQAHIIADRAARMKSLSTDDRIALAVLWSGITSGRDGNDHDLHIGIGAAPYLHATLDPLRARVDRTSSIYADIIAARFLRPADVRGDRTSLHAAQTAALTSAFVLYDAVIGGMDDVLRRRIETQQHSELTIFSIVFLTMAIAVVFNTIVAQSDARRLSQVTVAIGALVQDDMARFAALTETIAHGDFRPHEFERRPVLDGRGRDEPAVLAQSYNALASRIYDVNESFARMTAALDPLVKGVGNAAGRLASIALSMSDATSAAEHEIGQIASEAVMVADDSQSQAARINDATLAVTDILNTSREIGSGANAQSDAVKAANGGVAGLDERIGRVAALGLSLATAAERTAEQSTHGSAAVDQTAQAMAQLRAESASSKR